MNLEKLSEIASLHFENQDYITAVEWYRKAAERGSAHAQCNLGFLYENGQGVQKNNKTAIEWYRKAAEQNNINAQFNLANLYYKGEGVPQNHEVAVEWYRKAAEQGDSEAQFNLGNSYYKGEGVSQNHEVAVEWYRKAAEQGDSDAQCSLGNRYYKGEGVPQNHEIAVEWYRKAAEQGHTNAQLTLRDIQQIYVNKNFSDNTLLLNSSNNYSDWTKWENDFHQNGLLDGKSISELEKFVIEKNFKDDFRTWLGMWRVYTGIALPDIHNKMYDHATTILELELMKWGASSELTNLINRSIKQIEKNGEKIHRNKHISESHQKSNTYSALDYIVNTFERYIEVNFNDDVFEKENKGESTESFIFAITGQSILLTLDDTFRKLAILNKTNEELYQYIEYIASLSFEPLTKEKELKVCKKALELAKKAKKIEISLTNKKSKKSLDGLVLLNKSNALQDKINNLENENNTLAAKITRLNNLLRSSSFTLVEPIKRSINNLNEKKLKFLNALKEGKSDKHELLEKIKNCNIKIDIKNNELNDLLDISESELKEELKFSLKKREENLKLIEHLYYQKSSIKSKIYL